MLSLRIISKTEEYSNFFKFELLSDYGLYMVLVNNANQDLIRIKPLCDQFDIKLGAFKDKLAEFANKGLITVESEAINESIILNVEILPEMREEQSVNYLFTLLNNLFYLSEAQIKQIIEVSTVNGDINHEYLKVSVLNAVTRLNLPNKMDDFTINTTEDALYFFKTVAPHEIFNSWNCHISNRDYSFIYEEGVEQNSPVELINLAIDYTIKTNIYNSFNADFAKKNLSTWRNNNISTAEEALEYIKRKKEESLVNKTKGAYNEPTWNKVEINEENLISAKELEMLLNGQK